MIGPVKTRNRIIKTANGTSYVDPDQTCGDRMIAYYERLARGGVGFLIVESCGVEYPLGIQHVHYQPDGSYQGVQLHFDDDRFIPGFQRLTDAVHKLGCPVSIQFQHAGAVEPHRPAAAGHEDPRHQVRLGHDRGGAARPRLPALPGHDQAGARRPDRPVGLRRRAGLEGRLRRLRDQPRHGAPGQHLPVAHLEQARRRVRPAELREPHPLHPRHHRARPSAAAARTSRCTPSSTPPSTTIRWPPRSKRAPRWPSSSARWPTASTCAASATGTGAASCSPTGSCIPSRPYDLPKDLDWSRRGDGATVPLVEAVKRKGVKVPVWTASRIDAEMGREVPARGQARLRGHDPLPAGRSRVSQQGPRRPARRRAALPGLPALLRDAQPQQEARVPGERHPGPGDHARVPGDARPSSARRCSSSAAGPPAWKRRASRPSAATRWCSTRRTPGWAAWCRWRPSSRTARRPNCSDFVTLRGAASCARTR